jgi:CMP-N,N'-diacetyllegionaminic acid synthase
MVRGQPVTAIIPVRGGSKGVPGKNLYRLGRDTLLERTIKLAKKCQYIDRTLVTTDHPEMHTIAASYGVSSSTLRPAYLATDDAKTVDVILHLIDAEKIEEGYILLLQVTSPLRTLDDLSGLCRTFDEANPSVDAIVSLTAHDDPHPDKIQKIENGYVQSYLGVESMVPRQYLPKVYRLNGAFYLTHADILKSKHTFLPEKTLPFIMPKERSVNLDNMMDIYLLETMVTRKIVELEK